MKTRLWILPLGACLGWCCGCGPLDDAPSFEIEPLTATVSAGGSAGFSVIGTEEEVPFDPGPPEVVWASSDASVARLSDGVRGRFEALRPGTAIIKATYFDPMLSADRTAEAMLVVQPSQKRGAQPSPTFVASSAVDLAGVLSSDFKGTVFIPGDAAIDLTGYRDLPLKGGVTLRSDRGGTRKGALLYTHDRQRGDDYSVFVVSEGDVLVEGIRFEGPSQTPDDVVGASAIHVLSGPAFRPGQPRNIVVRDSEFYGWTLAGVNIRGPVGVRCPEDLPPEQRERRPAEAMSREQADEIRVTRNFFHDNVKDTKGYGVVISGGAYATVEGNVFDRNRHAVASNGGPYTGYLAYGNYVLEGAHKEGGFTGYYNQIFDMHGCGENGWGGAAGEYLEIANNTVLADEKYALGTKSLPAVWVRGTPTDVFRFIRNALRSDDREDAIRYEGGRSRLRVENNRLGIDYSRSLAVGDFDGDGVDDVFVATGSAWYFSSGGVAPWRFLARSVLTLEEIGIGDFDGDGRSDVLYSGRDGRLGYFSSRGGEVKAGLSAPGVPVSRLRFGDFDGDGRTDVFLASGGRWLVSWAGRTAWEEVNQSSDPVQELRLGDFDGDGRTDVFGIDGGHFAWVSGARGTWRHLGRSYGLSAKDVSLGDFNGDGRTDVAWESGSGWSYSSGGIGAPAPLRSKEKGRTGPRRCQQDKEWERKEARRPYDTLSDGVIGKFTSGPTAGRAAFLRFEEYEPSDPCIPSQREPGVGRRFALWVLGGGSGSRFVNHSWQNMR